MAAPVRTAAGRQLEAISRLQRAFATAPDPLQVHARQPGNNAAATDGSARDAVAQLARARLLLDAGDSAGGLAVVRTASRFDADDPALVYDCGVMFLQLRQFDDAVRMLLRATRLKPDSAQAWVNLGVALDRVANEGAAVEAYQRAITLAPGKVEVHAHLGGLLMTVGRYKEAREALDRAAAIGPDTLHGRLARVRSLILDERLAEAEAGLRRIIARHPAASPALQVLGDLLLRQGRFDESADTYLRAVEADPANVSLWLGLTQARKITEAARDLVGRMERLADTGQLAEREASLLHFALGKSYDDLGEPARAIRHFDAANRIRGRVGQLDRVEWTRRIDRLIARFTPEFLARHQGIGVSDATPILIVGMPRSGTTLMEQIVTSHPMVAGGDELLFWGTQDAVLLRPGPDGLSPAEAGWLAAEYRAVLRGISADLPRVTDKMPFNFLPAGLIHLVFPNARIIHCRRNPIDTCLSIYTNYFTTKMLFASARRDLVFYYRQYERLMAHWRRVLPPERFLEVEYEAVIGDREATTHQIIDFLGLPWDDACFTPERNERRVRTASVWQARQPVYSTSVERWRRYEPWIGELRQLLEPAEAG